MKDFYANVNIYLRADTQKQAEQEVRNALQYCCQDIYNSLEGFSIESCKTEQFHCECCGHECYENAEPTIVFTDKHTGNRYCSDCSIDYEEIEDGRIILRDQE